MVQMVPEVYENETYSEKRFFDTIKLSFLNSRYICFSSLGNDYHETKTYSEIDFLLITDEGFIICIEHKGGEVKIDQNTTTVTTGRKSYIKKENIIKQVQGGRQSIIKYLKNFELGHLFKVEWCLVIPEDEHVKSTIEIKDWRLFKGTYDNKKFEFFINKLIHELKKQPAYKAIKKVNYQSLGRLVKYLNPELKIKTYDASNLELIELEKDQISKLDAVTNGNIKRIVFNGGPGSGKTILAISMAKKLSIQGYKILFLCYNTLLSEKLNNDLEGYEDIYCATFDKFIIKNISLKKSNHLLEKNFKNKIEVFTNLVDSKLLYENDESKYDFIIIDEAQDLMNIDTMKVIFMALKKGIEKGNFALFLDNNVQAEMYNNFDKNYYEKFINQDNVTDYYLASNYRNPEGIIRQAAGIRNIDPPIIKRNYDSHPHIKTFLNKNNGENKTIIETYNMESKGIDVKKIIILFAYKKYLELFKKELIKLNKHNNQYQYNTISAFKGLEKEVVILAGLGDILGEKEDNNWLTSIIYVGLTRATKKAYIITNKRNVRFL